MCVCVLGAGGNGPDLDPERLASDRMGLALQPSPLEVGIVGPAGQATVLVRGVGVGQVAGTVEVPENTRKFRRLESSKKS